MSDDTGDTRATTCAAGRHTATRVAHAATARSDTRHRMRHTSAHAHTNQATDATRLCARAAFSPRGAEAFTQRPGEPLTLTRVRTAPEVAHIPASSRAAIGHPSKPMHRLRLSVKGMPAPPPRRGRIPPAARRPARTRTRRRSPLVECTPPRTCRLDAEICTRKADARVERVCGRWGRQHAMPLACICAPAASTT